ncbi:MAG: hypothetical protein A2W93_05215 [Bacteroidetes bacterium GWF2_43_63]|nr:MAG: hypothetical protein A2W93_05215 [Bacteroidetes bacterium GWF2_43_63]HBG71952.1 hypothetical protein [Bacteroidales bacterium]
MLLFIGVIVVTSCQIEKRQYMKGFFLGQRATGKVVQCDSSQFADTFIDNVDTMKDADVCATQPELVSAPDQTNDSVQKEHFSMEKALTQSISNVDSGFPSVFKRFLIRKTSLLTAIPATCDTKKLHPLAILGLGFLGLSIVLFLLYSNFLWTISNILGFLSILFYILSIVSLFIARRKTLQNKDNWSGIVMIKTVLTIELVLLCVFLIAFVAVWFLVITI